MSKVRVYDLAKEAGMKSTVLAEKLIGLGYNIKGHSSTVEEEVADEIRRNVLGTVETEVVEKRISTKGRATIIRRRSQTVRKVTEPAPPVEEVADAAAEEPVADEKEKAAPAKKPAKKKKVAKKPAKKKAVKKKVKEEAAAPAEEAVEQEEKPEAAVTPEVTAEAAAAEAAAAEVEPEEKPEEKEPVEAEKKEEKPKPKAVKRIVPPRKGLAKVIKKAAIEVPAEEPKAPAKPKRATKGKPKLALVGDVPEVSPEEVSDSEAGRAGKGKKKGKRLVQFRSEGDEQISSS